MTQGREARNTYGATEATVVAGASLMTGEEPIRIGAAAERLELAVVDEAGEPVAMGGSGQLATAGSVSPVSRRREGRGEVRAAQVARLGAGVPQW